MTYTFIHTADWQIGHSFDLFEREMRQKLDRAIFRAVELTFIYARNKGIPLLLCAGNAVDNGQTCAKEDLLELFRIIRKYPGIRVVMTTGSNDPLGAGNVYQRVERDSYPENFHLVRGEEVISYPEWNLEIYATSIRERNKQGNPLAWVKQETPDRGKLRIGMSHGFMGGMGGGVEPGEANPIPLGYVGEYGLDYLALGGRRSFKKIDDRAYYPGGPEPLNFGEEGSALEVTLRGPGEVPEVAPIPAVNQFRWRREQIRLSEETYEEFKNRYQELREKEIIRYEISGDMPIRHYKAYKELLAMNRRSNIQVEDQVTISSADEELLERGDGIVRAVVQRLLEMKRTGEAMPVEVNPFAPVTRENVHAQAESISSREVIDRALLKLYNYINHEKK